MSAQYRVAVSKGNERVEGPDGADVVFTIGVKDVAAAAADPAVAFMRGVLKASGNTGVLLVVLRNGEAASALTGLAAG
jgi:hypothetical protein